MRPRLRRGPTTTAALIQRRLDDQPPLSKPGPSAATIARRVRRLAEDRGWPAPAYSTVAAIVAALDLALVTQRRAREPAGER